MMIKGLTLLYGLTLLLLFCSFWITLLVCRKGKNRIKNEIKQSITEFKDLSQSAIKMVFWIYCCRIVFMLIMGIRSHLSCYMALRSLLAFLPALLVGLILIHQKIKERVEG